VSPANIQRSAALVGFFEKTDSGIIEIDNQWKMAQVAGLFSQKSR